MNLICHQSEVKFKSKGNRMFQSFYKCRLLNLVTGNFRFRWPGKWCLWNCLLKFWSQAPCFRKRQGQFQASPKKLIAAGFVFKVESKCQILRSYFWTAWTWLPACEHSSMCSTASNPIITDIIWLLFQMGFHGCFASGVNTVHQVIWMNHSISCTLIRGVTTLWQLLPWWICSS